MPSHIRKLVKKMDSYKSKMDEANREMREIESSNRDVLKLLSKARSKKHRYFHKYRSARFGLSCSPAPGVEMGRG